LVKPVLSEVEGAPVETNLIPVIVSGLRCMSKTESVVA